MRSVHRRRQLTPEPAPAASPWKLPLALLAVTVLVAWIAWFAPWNRRPSPVAVEVEGGVPPPASQAPAAPPTATQAAPPAPVASQAAPATPVAPAPNGGAAAPSTR